MSVDRRVFAWGDNDDGKLGDCTTEDRKKPVTVKADASTYLTDVKSIDASRMESTPYSTTARLNGGVVYSLLAIRGTLPRLLRMQGELPSHT